MAACNQNRNTVSALRTRNHQVELEEVPINIRYGILVQIFKVLDEEDNQRKEPVLCLATLSKKSENVIASIVKKPHNFMKKTKNYLLKTQMILRIYVQISQKQGKKKCLLGMCHVAVFYQNLARYHSSTLENYSNFFKKLLILFNNGSSILEINDYCNNRSRGNVSYNEFCEIINTLSN